MASPDRFFILIAVLFCRFVDGCLELITVEFEALLGEFGRGICVSATTGEGFV